LEISQIFALAVFLVAVGVGLGWAFLRLAVTFDRLSFVDSWTEREVLPLSTRSGLGRPGERAGWTSSIPATDSAVDAVGASTSRALGQLRREAAGAEAHRLSARCVARLGVTARRARLLGLDGRCKGASARRERDLARSESDHPFLRD